MNYYYLCYLTLYDKSVLVKTVHHIEGKTDKASEVTFLIFLLVLRSGFFLEQYK